MKSKGKSVLGFFCLLTLIPALQAAWTTKRLTNNTGDSYMPSVAAKSSNVYVVWYDYTLGNGEIYFRKSTDKGLTWQTAKRLTNNTGDSCYPRIAISGSNIYVVWCDDTPGNYDVYFRKSTDYGETWEAAKRLTNNAGQSYSPFIAASGSDVYVVWYDDTPSNYEIYVRKSANEGATWQTAKRLTNNTGDSYCTTIAVNSANVYVVWYDHTPGNPEIYFRCSADGGTTWQTAKRLTNNAGSSYDPKIAVVSSNVYVIWYDTTPGQEEIYFRRSADGGATWQTAKRLTTTPATSYSGYPSVAAYLSKIYTVYEHDFSGNVEIYYKRSGDNGATWSDAQNLTHTAGTSYWPDIALGGSQIYVVYEDNTLGQYEIYIKFTPLY